MVEIAVPVVKVKLHGACETDIQSDGGQRLEKLYEVTIVASFEDGGDEPAMQRSLSQLVLVEQSEGGGR